MERTKYKYRRSEVRLLCRRVYRFHVGPAPIPVRLYSSLTVPERSFFPTVDVVWVASRKLNGLVPHGRLTSETASCLAFVVL